MTVGEIITNYFNYSFLTNSKKELKIILSEIRTELERIWYTI